MKSVKQQAIQQLKKLRNTLLVIKNQKDILSACATNKQIHLSPVAPGSKGGTIEHYYHFVFDLVLPLSILIRSSKYDTVFAIKDFGIFTSRLTEIFKNQVKILPGSSDFDTVQPFKLIGMNPVGVFLSKNTLEAFKCDILNRFEISKTEERNYILLIERLPPDPYFIERAKVKGAGASRRSILNHCNLQSRIQKMVKEPYDFQNLQLETLTFKEQIKYFGQAQVVIAGNRTRFRDLEVIRHDEKWKENLSHDQTAIIQKYSGPVSEALDYQ